MPEVNDTVAVLFAPDPDERDPYEELLTLARGRVLTDTFFDPNVFMIEALGYEIKLPRHTKEGGRLDYSRARSLAATMLLSRLNDEQKAILAKRAAEGSPEVTGLALAKAMPEPTTTDLGDGTYEHRVVLPTLEQLGNADTAFAELRLADKLDDADRQIDELEGGDYDPVWYTDAD